MLNKIDSAIKLIRRIQRENKYLLKYGKKLDDDGIDLELKSANEEKGKQSDCPEMHPEQQKWIEQYAERIANIPDSNGCRYYERLPYRVGLICDEFFYESISAAADFVFITPDNWQEELDRGMDAMLFVTAWRGLHGEWRELGKVKDMETNPVRLLALKILDSCKGKGIPTIFYSKEDPPNYEVFLDYARHCEYICTTAKECIPYYQSDCNTDKVQSVCFGINPMFHNPIGFRNGKKEDTVLFSGSWMLKYPDRCKELSVIFDGILESGHGLHIIDRNYPGNPKYCFPEKYFAYSSPALPHDVLQKVHKLFDWAVNINSVKASETMFANRAFELQANGVMLLSNLSVGVNSILPTVQMVTESSEVGRIMNSLTGEELYERQIAGIRSVMTNHTCFDRMNQLLRPTGLLFEQPKRRILVIAEELTPAVRNCFDNQTYQEKTLMDACLVSADVLTEYDMITWFDNAASYGVFYLEDMVNGFKYTACDYITKDAWYEGGNLHEGIEHNYVSKMGSKYRTVFWREAFSPEFLLSVSGEHQLENGYSIDHFNYECHPVCKDVADKQYLLSVIVPVYNNGMHLYGKCFASLRRSSMFQDMEIILVDDGSTDEYTKKVETYLYQKYSNVRLFRYEDGGSGSASRPRNKGVELASCQYLAYLDPDDEAMCDGYAKLYRIAAEDSHDLVIGNMYRCTDQTKLANFVTVLSKYMQQSVQDNGIDNLLVDCNFIAPSIQAMIIRKDLITGNGLEQVTGAIGEDSLFSWQLMHYSKHLYVSDIPVRIYYAQTAGSVTNVVNSNFFHKLLLLQKPKKDWLEHTGYLHDYMLQKYEPYTVNYVFRKLSLVGEEDQAECAKLAEQILNVFAEYYQGSNPLITQFMEKCQAGDYDGAARYIGEKLPVQKVRPMLTMEELTASSQKVVRQRVTCYQKGNKFFFNNLSAEEETVYAWAVLLNGQGYHKIFETRYTKKTEFSFDFSGLQPDVYKVRAFQKNQSGKISEDVAYIKLDSTGNAKLDTSKSTLEPTKNGFIAGPQ